MFENIGKQYMLVKMILYIILYVHVFFFFLRLLLMLLKVSANPLWYACMYAPG